MARFLIDLGYGGSERAESSPTQQGATGALEEDVTLDIAKHVIARFCGATALTRTGGSQARPAPALPPLPRRRLQL